MAAWIVIVLVATVAFTVAAALTGWCVFRGRNRWLVDHPKKRSLHDRPVSRAGGIAILAGLAAGLALAALTATVVQGHAWVLVGALVVAGVSLLDDVTGVSPAIRIVFHFVAAACMVQGGLSAERILFPGGALELGSVAGPVFTLLFVAWFVNLYNFMDGMDGFAGGMATIGFATLALLCAPRGTVMLVAASLAAAGASLGFLLFNFPPAKIFMGDLGSTLLGYFSAVVMLWADHTASVPLWISVLVFSPFIVDATVTLLRRILAGERPWRPHLGHFYQRLVRLGWGHRKTVLCEYGLMFACAGSAVAALWAAPAAQAVLLGGWVVGYVVLVLAVTSLERRAGS